MLSRLKDWKTTVPGAALSLALAYFCPELVKDVTTPGGVLTALVTLGPAILGALSHSSKEKAA